MLAKTNPLPFFTKRMAFTEDIRFFSKIRNFKNRYPELYEHVHPDSKILFDQPWIGSGQKVKWVCDKGPDHVWEAEVGQRIRAYNHSKKCKLIFSFRIFSCLSLLYWS